VLDRADAESIAAQYDWMLDTLVDKLPKVAGHPTAPSCYEPSIHTATRPSVVVDL
jgi:hypothetical protein